MRSHVSCPWCNRVFVEMDCVALASFMAWARGINFFCSSNCVVICYMIVEPLGLEHCTTLDYLPHSVITLRDHMCRMVRGNPIVKHCFACIVAESC